MVIKHVYAHFRSYEYPLEKPAGGAAGQQDRNNKTIVTIGHKY